MGSRVKLYFAMGGILVGVVEGMERMELDGNGHLLW